MSIISKLLSRKGQPEQVRLMRATNLTRDTVLADRAVIAETSSTRRTGLLKHASLSRGEGMWIAPCECVHTFGMRFPIDIVFISKRHQVVRAVENVAKRRVAMAWRARSVLELPAGTIALTGTKPGDSLRLEAVKIELAEERPQADRSRSGGEDGERKLAAADRRRSCFSSFEATLVAALIAWLAILAIAYRMVGLAVNPADYAMAAPIIASMFGIGVFVNREGAHKLAQTCIVAGCSFGLALALSLMAHACGRSQAPFIDEHLLRFDRSVGFSAAAVVAAVQHAPLERAILEHAYSSLALLLAGCLIVPIWCGHISESRRLMVAVGIMAAAAELTAALWPAQGPWAQYGYAPSPMQAAINAYLLQLRSGQPMTVDMNLGALVTFPSGRTAMAILCAIAVRRIRVLQFVAGVMAAGICVSTISTGWHYGVDVVCGAALALAGYAASAPVVRWMERGAWMTKLGGRRAPRRMGAPETAPVQ